MNWSSIASLLADSVVQPLLVIDHVGDVQLINEPMEMLLGRSREQVVGHPLVNLVPRDRRDRVASLLRGALQGARRRGEVWVVATGGAHLWLSVELALVTGVTGSGLVGRVVASAQEAQAAPMLTDPWFEIGLDDDFGRVRQVHGDDAHTAVGRPCYQVVADRDSPCPDCPVGKLGVGETVTDLQLLTDERLIVRRARRASAQTALVAYTPLGPGLVSQLVEARLDALATRCALSERERQVLRELVAGRALEDIARVLEISTRTVRFHQANVLAKLGIDSRLELVRMLLE